nr:MAG TPA: hypothetical protein [Caudoviricetes sp.]
MFFIQFSGLLSGFPPAKRDFISISQVNHN